MPQINGWIRNQSELGLATVPVHVGFVSEKLASEQHAQAFLHNTQQHLDAQGFCWSRTDAAGRCTGLAKQLLHTDTCGGFCCWCPPDCGVEMAIYAEGIVPCFQRLTATEVDGQTLEISLHPQTTDAFSYVRIEGCESLDLDGILLKGVDTSLATQPELPAQRLGHNGRFHCEHLLSNHKYGFVLFVADGDAPFHSALASPAAGQQLIFQSRSH